MTCSALIIKNKIGMIFSSSIIPEKPFLQHVVKLIYIILILVLSHIKI